MAHAMVEVFKTNVQKKSESKKLLGTLLHAFPAYTINFDLSDCDKVLRIKGENIEVLKIIGHLRKYGYHCEPLE
jgi:tRNA G26 N,N-dimethylase Trm1